MVASSLAGVGGGGGVYAGATGGERGTNRTTGGGRKEAQVAVPRDRDAEEKNDKRGSVLRQPGCRKHARTAGKTIAGISYPSAKRRLSVTNRLPEVFPEEVFPEKQSEGCWQENLARRQA